MVQSIGIWFANKAKEVVRDPESTTQSLGKARINKPGIQWNKRLVAAELHAKWFSEIYQQLIQEYDGVILLMEGVGWVWLPGGHYMHVFCFLVKKGIIIFELTFSLSSGSEPL
jgi:hypothetical protein